jgi:hypothetical protein
MRGAMKPTGLTLLSSVNWITALGDTVSLASPGPTFSATTSNNTNTFGVFSGVLPSSGQYYIDITLASGQDSSPSSVGFLGLSNTVGSFAYTTSANYKAWYWSGNWFGDATTISAGDSSALVTGTYRIAIDRPNSVFYMQRISGTPSTVREAVLPGSNIFLMSLPQSGFRTYGATILNGGLVSGHGGLY